MKRSSIALSLFVSLVAVACSSASSTPDGYSNDDGSNNGSSNTPGGSSTSTPGNNNTGSNSSSNNNSTGSSGNNNNSTGNSTSTVNTYVDGLTINEIAVYQAVKIDVVSNGAKVSKTNAPIVAGRPGTMRVYVTPGSGYTSHAVTAELRIYASGTTTPTNVIKDTKTLTGASTDADTSTTFDFDFAATDMTEGMKFAVALTDPNGKSDATLGSVYPSGGTPDTLGAENTGVVKVVLVPVTYMADKSGRTPDTSASQITLLQNEMMNHYPATDIQITVHAPWTYSSTVSANGNGWSQILTAVTQLRQTDNAPDDVYYFASFEPAASEDSYCDEGCVAGLSTVVDEASDAADRDSVGLGFTGQDAAVTMAHEVGHAHGRSHAPCAQGGTISGVDPNFPYSTGGIGVNGYDIVAKTFISSSTGKDIMGYCTPEWISDYTYSALFARVQAVNGTSEIIATKTKFRHITENPDGTFSDGSPINVTLTPSTNATVSYVDANGNVLSTPGAHFVPFDHLPGGMWTVPEGPSNTVQIKGQTITLP